MVANDLVKPGTQFFKIPSDRGIGMSLTSRPQPTGAALVVLWHTVPQQVKFVQTPLRKSIPFFRCLEAPAERVSRVLGFDVLLLAGTREYEYDFGFKTIPSVIIVEVAPGAMIPSSSNNL